MMVRYSVLRSAFHLVQDRTLWSSTRKPFWPASHGGQKIHVREFQNLLIAQRNKVLVGLRLASDPANGIASMTFLGQTLVSRLRPNLDIANYLYKDGIIHPRFFAEALHVIASNSKALAPHTLKIQLKQLGRNSLKSTLDSGAISTQEIGKEFDRFSSLKPQEKLEVLQKLGVLQLKQGSTIEDILVNRPQKHQPDPPAPNTRTEPQLNLFDRLEPKKPT